MVTSLAYRNFISLVEDRIEKLLANLNKESLGAIPRIANEIQQLILKVDMPREIADELLDAYDSMNIEVSQRYLRSFDFLKRGARGTVVVRSCPIARDIDTTKNFEYATFLNLTGATQLRRAVQACFAAVFTQKNIKHRLLNDIDFRDVSVAVLVQRMIRSDKSGVMYTANPDGERTEAYIEAVWGLGRTLDEVYPDKYVIGKLNNKVISAQAAQQSWGYYGDAQGRIVQQELPTKKITEPKLNSHNLIMLSNLARELEENYGQAFKIEFGVVGEDIWLLKMDSLQQVKQKPGNSGYSYTVEGESAKDETLVPGALESTINRLKMEEERKETETMEPERAKERDTEHKVEPTPEVIREARGEDKEEAGEEQKQGDGTEKEEDDEEKEETRKPEDESGDGIGKAEEIETQNIEKIEGTERDDEEGKDSESSAEIAEERASVLMPEMTEEEMERLMKEYDEQVKTEEQTPEEKATDNRKKDRDEADTVLLPEMTEEEMEQLLEKFEETEDTGTGTGDAGSTAQEPEEFVEEPDEGESEETDQDTEKESDEEKRSEEREVEFVPKADEFSESIKKKKTEELEPGQTLTADEIIRQASEEDSGKDQEAKKDAKGFDMQVIEACESLCQRFPDSEKALKIFRDEVLRLYRSG